MRVHACRHCGEVFPSYSDLRQHLDSHASGPLLDMLRKHVALLETNCCAFVEAVANIRVACGDVDARAHPYM